MDEIEGRRPRAGRRAAVLGGQTSAEWGGWAGAFAGDLRARLASALRAEADAGRLVPWLAVAFGVGVLLYFAAPSEPSLGASIILTIVLCAGAWASRERTVLFAVSIALATAAGGFMAGCVRAALVEHQPMTGAARTITVQGYVESRDATERSDRVVLLVTGSKGRGASNMPERVRVAFRGGTAPSVGEHVEALARLSPPLGPVRPGGYDYARGMYFQGIGATGFAYGRARPAQAAPAPWSIRVAAAVEMMRRSLASRIRSLLPGEAGAIAGALVTGVRDEVSAETNEAMRISGLYHLLSISGLHMALIAGALFALIRGGLALVPRLALRRPIKKWAAVAAFAGCAFYLVLSGAEVATQRSFIMIAIVLGGVLVDRPALTVRTLATAAFGVLLLQPEALLSPSFQMSFAATLALVALYERCVPLMAVAPAGGGALAHLSERAWRWLLLGTATSLFAGLATVAYVAFHFQRLAPYSVLANLLAMPLISFVIMPAGLLSVLLLPFGYDAYGWKIMGAGIEGMLKIAEWVAALPGADGRFAAFGAGALLLATVGILLLALPVTWLRLAGLPPLAISFVLAATAPRPDVLIDDAGQTVAVRGAEGRLQILNSGGSRFIAENWLAADADRRKAGKETEKGFACDPWGCVALLSDGTKVAVARRREAFTDDCREAGLVISTFEVPKGCLAATVDRATLASTGALALWRKDGIWMAEPSRALYADRPWYGRTKPVDADALAGLTGRQNAQRAITAPADADPQNDALPEAIAPGDE